MSLANSSPNSLGSLFLPFVAIETGVSSRKTDAHLLIGSFAFVSCSLIVYLLRCVVNVEHWDSTTTLKVEFSIQQVNSRQADDVIFLSSHRS